MSGVQARLAIREPPSCPVVDALSDGASATDVGWTSGDESSGDGSVVEQVHSTSVLETQADFETGGEGVYRVRRAASADCPCSVIASCGHPVTDVRVRNDPRELVVTVHLPSPEPLEEIVEAIEATGTRTELRYLVCTKSKVGTDPVVVDRRRLTSRQREVLETAHRMGYFEYPRRTNAEGVAREIGIARSTFAEHLAVAQSRLVGSALGDG